MCVCVYVYKCVSVYVCMCVCVQVCKCVCVYVCTYVCPSKRAWYEWGPHAAPSPPCWCEIGVRENKLGITIVLHSGWCARRGMRKGNQRKCWGCKRNDSKLFAALFSWKEKTMPNNSSSSSNNNNNNNNNNTHLPITCLCNNIKQVITFTYGREQ